MSYLLEWVRHNLWNLLLLEEHLYPALSSRKGNH